MAIDIKYGEELSEWKDLVTSRKSPNTQQEKKFVQIIRLFRQARDLNGLLSLGSNKFEKLTGNLEGLYSSRMSKKDRLIIRVEELTYEEAVEFNPDYRNRLKNTKETLTVLIFELIDKEHYKRTERWWKSKQKKVTGIGKSEKF